jgi:hypothetical protein
LVCSSSAELKSRGESINDFDVFYYRWPELACVFFSAISTRSCLPLSILVAIAVAVCRIANAVLPRS